MKKMLFLTPQFPFPLDNGGKKGSLNGVLTMNQLYEITVLSFTEQPSYIKKGLENLATIENVTFCEPIVHDIHIRKKPLKLFITLLRGLLLGVPYIVSKYESRLMYKKIDLYFKNNECDTVFIDYLNMARYGNYIKRKYNIKNFIFKDHNIEADLVKQELMKSKHLKKIVLKREYSLTQKYEINFIKKADKCFSVCDENTEFLRKYNKKSFTMNPVYKIDNSVHTLSNDKRIFYFGNLSWQANFMGLIWFLDSVFPLVKSKVEDAKLIIAGSGLKNNPFEKYGDSVEYLGFVENIDGIYDDKSVFIVPLFEGSGIRIKILDALNHDISVVSTTVGCGTIGLVNDENILIADNIEDFSGAVIKLLTDKNFNEKIRKNGKIFLKDNYSLEKVRKEFENNINNEVR